MSSHCCSVETIDDTEHVKDCPRFRTWQRCKGCGSMKPEVYFQDEFYLPLCDSFMGEAIYYGLGRKCTCEKLGKPMDAAIKLYGDEDFDETTKAT